MLNSHRRDDSLATCATTYHAALKQLPNKWATLDFAGYQYFNETVFEFRQCDSCQTTLCRAVLIAKVVYIPVDAEGYPVNSIIMAGGSHDH